MIFDMTKRVGGGTASAWELIAEKTIALEEYTATDVPQVTETGISILNCGDYEWLVATITCDGTITSTSEWGMTYFVGFRYGASTSRGKLTGISYQLKGYQSAFLSDIAATASTYNYGCAVQTNSDNFNFSRKAHATGMPKIRAGNYTVKVYGLKSL